MVKPKGLGRGLDALLAVNHSDDQLQTLPVTAIQPGKYQPRTRMDAASLESLAESIRAQGVIQPLVVRPVGYERYELIAGERRWHDTDQCAHDGRQGGMPIRQAQHGAENDHRQRQTNLPDQNITYGMGQLLGQPKHELRDYTHRASRPSMNSAVLYKTGYVLNI